MLTSLFGWLAEQAAIFWLSVLEPRVNDDDDDADDVAPGRRGAREAWPQRPGGRPGGEGGARRGPERSIVVPEMYRQQGDSEAPVEGFVSDASFLTQLEQRTQQVKITLANLEAEKARIEALISRLQPLVPHYDNLLDAERALQDAQIPLESPPAPQAEEQPQEQGGNQWGFQQQQQSSEETRDW